MNQSPQLFKQILMSGGFDRVFEIGPIFRAEEHDTRRHLNEATSIDVEVSFADHFDVMEILENLVAYAYTKVIENCKSSLEVLGVELKVPKTPFLKLTYNEVIEIINAHSEEKMHWETILALWESILWAITSTRPQENPTTSLLTGQLRLNLSMPCLMKTGLNSANLST